MSEKDLQRKHEIYRDVVDEIEGRRDTFLDELKSRGAKEDELFRYFRAFNVATGAIEFAITCDKLAQKTYPATLAEPKPVTWEHETR